MRFTIHVPFEFRASHTLNARPQAHFHRYELVLTMGGPLNPKDGFVVDMYKVREAAAPFIARLDGAHLNGHPMLAVHEGEGRIAGVFPTCEALALFFAESLRDKLNRLAAGAWLSGVQVRLLEDALHETDGVMEWGRAEVALERDGP